MVLPMPGDDDPLGSVVNSIQVFINPIVSYFKNCFNNVNMEKRKSSGTLVINREKCNFPLGEECGNSKHQLSVFDGASTRSLNQFENLKSLLSSTGSLNHGFLMGLKFAQVGGVPSTRVHVTSVKPSKETNDDDEEGIVHGEISFSIVELNKLLSYVGRRSKGVKFLPPQVEAEGKYFFQELDRDGDGQVTVEDLEIAMEKRKLPKRYAHEFMRRTKSHLFSKSFGWKQFSSLMEEKEPNTLRAYTSLCLCKFQKSEIFASLENTGHPANEVNDAVTVMNYMNASMAKEHISYAQFRNFMLLLPSDQPSIKSDSVLKSALAGGLSCALSASIMHPVDTVKTWVQASTLTFPEVMSKVPQFGVRALYKGSIPAILGQFSSHGLRTGICEASKLVLLNVAPTLSDIQVESMASFCGTFLGTTMRIPCEVLKQRLQAGLFEDVGEAIVGTWKQDGLNGFFRGTGATLCREIPFYVAGMALYAESKKAVQRLTGRELQPWETVAVGALSGGLTAVFTTPIDVIKTRMMIATGGQTSTLSVIVLSILHKEGPRGLFKGAVPRFFWVAPLGAMNFSGYEILRRAMD